MVSAHVSGVSIPRVPEAQEERLKFSPVMRHDCALPGVTKRASRAHSTAGDEQAAGVQDGEHRLRFCEGLAFGATFDEPALEALLHALLHAVVVGLLRHASEVKMVPHAVIPEEAPVQARGRPWRSKKTRASTAQGLVYPSLSSVQCSHARFSNSLATPRYSVLFRHALILAEVAAFAAMTG